MTKKIVEKFNELRHKDKIVILGIETSCDETATAVVENGRILHSNVILSQIPLHQKFGGVVPEVASRNHILAINGVIDKALKQAQMQAKDLDAIAVTYGAGLIGALLVGVSTAKAIGYALKIPLIKVNHIEAHVCANFIAHKDLTPPFLCVAASGGHTSLIAVDEHNTYNSLGGTVDDAIGEAFDKVARLLGLPYPGGPEIDKLAKKGAANIDFYKTPKSINKDLRLSYSGLKTAVVNYVNSAKMAGREIVIEDICASFTKQAVDLLVDTTMFAAKERGDKVIALAGGVAANTYLRNRLQEETQKAEMDFFVPSLDLCTDNAAMVASRAYFSILAGTDLAGLDLNAKSNVKVGEGR